MSTLSGGIKIAVLSFLLPRSNAKIRENVIVTGPTQPPCWSRKSGECEFDTVAQEIDGN